MPQGPHGQESDLVPLGKEKRVLQGGVGVCLHTRVPSPRLSRNGETGYVNDIKSLENTLSHDRRKLAKPLSCYRPQIPTLPAIPSAGYFLLLL